MGKSDQEQEQVRLSDAEWRVMQCIWQTPGCTLRHLVGTLAWGKNTVITLLKRMQQKGAVQIVDTVPKTYLPLLAQRSALATETRDILQRVFGGNPLLMVQNAVEQAGFSDEEIEALLHHMKKEGM